MAITIEDLRARARRRLPRALFDFVDGGGEDEVTLQRNRAGFERITFRPRALVDVSHRDASTTVLGVPLASPLVLAPTGMPGLLWPRGEVVAARAAKAKGSIFTLATRATCCIEEVAEATGGHVWFQVYVWRDRDVTRRLVERAIEILQAEIDRTLGLLGRPRLSDLDRSALRLPSGLGARELVGTR